MISLYSSSCFRIFVIFSIRCKATDVFRPLRPAELMLTSQSTKEELILVELDYCILNDSIDHSHDRIRYRHSVETGDPVARKPILNERAIDPQTG
jgi:hypothetical protein